MMLPRAAPASAAWLDRLKPHTAASCDVSSRFAHFSDEPGIVFQSVFEPIVLRLKPDQHAGRLPVARDDDVAILGQPEVPGEIVLHFRERDFTARGCRGLGARPRLGLSQ